MVKVSKDLFDVETLVLSTTLRTLYALLEIQSLTAHYTDYKTHTKILA